MSQNTVDKLHSDFAPIRNSSVLAIILSDTCMVHLKIHSNQKKIIHLTFFKFSIKNSIFGDYTRKWEYESAADFKNQETVI